MKTYDEVVRSVSGDKTPEEVIAHYSRFDCLFKEILEHPLTPSLIRGYLAIASNVNWGVCDLLVNVFFAGICFGIEMEKQEDML
jgi:hypothetical protein